MKCIYTGTYTLPKVKKFCMKHCTLMYIHVHVYTEFSLVFYREDSGPLITALLFHYSALHFKLILLTCFTIFYLSFKHCKNKNGEQCSTHSKNIFLLMCKSPTLTIVYFGVVQMSFNTLFNSLVILKVVSVVCTYGILIMGLLVLC